MYQAILFLPLVGALFAGILGPFAGPRPAEVVTTTLVLITALTEWLAFFPPRVYRRRFATPISD